MRVNDQKCAWINYLCGGSSCKYLRSLFLPELHLSLHESLSPACLLLEPLLQFLPSSSLVFQGLPAYVHFTFLHKPNGVNHTHHDKHTSAFTLKSFALIGDSTRCSRSLCFSTWASRSKRSISSIFAILDILALWDKAVVTQSALNPSFASLRT